ncbi:hypothetical protein RYX36_002170, partial [Vicia faba]
SITHSKTTPKACKSVQILYKHAKKIGNNAFLNLILLLVGNVGLIFIKGDLKEVSEDVA